LLNVKRELRLPFLFALTPAKIAFLNHADRVNTRLQPGQNAGNDNSMLNLAVNPAPKDFVLQDTKRLPGRFYARLSGTLLSRLT